MESHIPNRHTLLITAGAIALVCIFGAFAYLSGDYVTPFVGLGLGMGFAKKDNDSQVYKTRALPAAASSSVNSDGIDLMNTAKGDFQANVEVLVEAPAVDTTMAPDTRTFTYDIYHDTDSAFGTEALLMKQVILQTGAGGAGAAAASTRVRLPVDVHRYIRLKITSGASTADASAVAATFRLVF